LIALVSVVTAAAGSDPPFYYPLLLIFSGYAVFFVLNAQSCRPALIRVLWFSSLVGIVALLVHAWWWIPFVAEQRSVLTTMIGSRDAIGSSSLKVLLENSAMSSFKNLFQTLGSAPFYHRFPTGRGIETWTPYPPVFAALSFTLLSFLFPIISLAGLLHSWSRRHAFLITGLFVALLFIMKAAHPPFGELFEWIAATPFGATLRTTYNKFGMGMAFVYAFAVGLGIVWLSGATYGLFRRLAAHAAKPLTAILVGSVCFSMFGLFGYLYLTGEVIPGPTALKAGARVEVPAYYGEADLWLQRQGTGFRVLNLPLTRLFYAAFEFKNGYWGVDPSLWLFRTPVIARITDETTYAAPLYLAQHLIDNSTPNQKRNMACLAGLLNVRYVMLHGDTNWAYVQGMPWWVTKPTDMTEDYLARSLDYQAGFHKATTIGKLHYYENDLYVPMAYAASNLTYLRGDLPQMEEVLNTCDPARPPAIFLSDLQPQLDAEASRLANRWTEDIMPPPQVTLAQVSPTLYKAHVRGASQPFMLVFSQSYHEGWNATIDGTPIPSHFMVNGYANAWFVEHPGDSDITIQFGPQKYLLFSGMLSAIGILGLLSGLVVLLLWRKKVRYGQH